MIHRNHILRNVRGGIAEVGASVLSSHISENVILGNGGLDLNLRNTDDVVERTVCETSAPAGLCPHPFPRFGFDTSISLGLNKQVFHAGDQLLLSATVDPHSVATTADVYVALLIPTGSLLFLQGGGNFTASIQPIVAGWPINSYSGQLFSYNFSAAEPSGDYAWLAFFTEPGTLNFIGTIATAPFRLSP